MYRFSRWMLVLSLGAFMAGCQSNVSREDGIRKALYAYDKTVRWVGVRDAYAFLRPDLVPPYLPPDLDKIQVVRYDVLDPPVEVEENKVIQRVEIQYIDVDTQVIHKLVDQQVWETEDDGKVWLRTNPIPSFQ